MERKDQINEEKEEEGEEEEEEGEKEGEKMIRRETTDWRNQ